MSFLCAELIRQRVETRVSLGCTLLLKTRGSKSLILDRADSFACACCVFESSVV